MLPQKGKNPIADDLFVLRRMKVFANRQVFPNHLTSEIEKSRSQIGAGITSDRANDVIFACAWVPAEIEAARFVSEHVDSVHGRDVSATSARAIEPYPGASILPSSKPSLRTFRS